MGSILLYGLLDKFGLFCLFLGFILGAFSVRLTARSLLCFYLKRISELCMQVFLHLNGTLRKCGAFRLLAEPHAVTQGFFPITNAQKYFQTGPYSVMHKKHR